MSKESDQFFKQTIRVKAEESRGRGKQEEEESRGSLQRKAEELKQRKAEERESRKAEEAEEAEESRRRVACSSHAHLPLLSANSLE